MNYGLKAFTWFSKYASPILLVIGTFVLVIGGVLIKKTPGFWPHACAIYFIMLGLSIITSVYFSWLTKIVEENNNNG